MIFFGSSLSLAGFLETIHLPHRPGISQGRAYQLAVTVRLLDRWHGRPVLVSQLSDSLVTEFLTEYARHAAPVTVNAKRSQLLTLWRAAHEAGHIRRLPGKVPRLREPRRMPEAWMAEEIAQLVAYARGLDGSVDGVARGAWWSSLFLAAYTTGCRATALRMARSRDCDLQAAWLLIRADVQKNDQDQLFRLSGQAVEAIRLHYDAERSLIWPWPYHFRTFAVHVRKIMEAAGLKPSRRGMGLMQRIRRTTVSYAARESLELARRLAGHSSVELTRKHYVDERIATVPSAVDVLPELDI